eukprot:350494-Chlamydomonas_euryale.AAC.19
MDADDGVLCHDDVQTSTSAGHDAAGGMPPRMVSVIQFPSEFRFFFKSASEEDRCSRCPRVQVAAMALSPLAALSLPLVQDAGWVQSMRDFGNSLRHKVRTWMDADATHQAARQLDEHITFMEWTYTVTGVDLSYVWDPELWVKFKDAVWNDQPQVFWNALMDRIDYSESHADCPCMHSHIHMHAFAWHECVRVHVDKYATRVQKTLPAFLVVFIVPSRAPA